MKSVIFAVLATVAVAGCTTAERDASLGAAAGATIGAIATGTGSGAVAGAVIGGVSGVLIGKATRDGWCVYRDRRGRLYEARCR